MSFPISISKTSEQLPIDPLLTVTRTAIGLGLGILMADKIKPPLRQVAAIALVAIGVLAAAPWFVKITLGQINRSEWGSRARLRAIRGDAGYSSDNDICKAERRLQKRFGNGIRYCFAFSSQNEIAIRFLKQPQRNKLACLLREAFQIRSASSVTRAQRQCDSLCAFHFLREIFARRAW